MYYYVEYLRAMRAMRIVGIVLGVLLLAGIVLRLSFIHGASPEAYVTDLQNSPSAHVTKTELPDGTVQTTIDDPKKNTHAVVLRKGNEFRLDVTEPAKAGRDHRHDTMSMGSVNMNEDTRGGVSRVTMTYRGGLDLSWSALFAGSAFMGLIVATMLGGSLAKENEGHLEIAWTKPTSREAYALAGFATDAVAIIVAQLLGIAAFLLCAMMWAMPTFTLGAGGFTLILLALLVPIAWYACLTSFSASLKRGPGMVIGLGWFAALVIPSVMAGTAHVQHPIAQGIHLIFTGLAYIDPIAYFPSFSGRGFHGHLVTSIEQAVIGAAALTLGYTVLAVLQWRRVEA